jgi:hypothetical protein
LGVIEDSISQCTFLQMTYTAEIQLSQCTFLQMTYTAENPHADGSPS